MGPPVPGIMGEVPGLVETPGAVGAVPVLGMTGEVPVGLPVPVPGVEGVVKVPGLVVAAPGAVVPL